MSSRPTRFAASLIVLAFALPAWGQGAEDAGSMAPTFKEGDVLTFDQIKKLRPYLPAEFWDNRDFFFYEGMRLEIGPTQKDYVPVGPYTGSVRCPSTIASRPLTLP